MNPTKPLSEIVRQVPDHVEATANYEKRVVINTDTSQAVSEVGFFQSFYGNFKAFIVTNNRNTQKIVSGHKSLKYREGAEEITFAIDYQGGCPPGSEMQLAQFFYRTSGPDKTISDSLGKWLIEYFSTNNHKIDQFYGEKDRAAGDLAAKAQSEFGLALTITVDVAGGTQLETVAIGPLVLSSRLLGSDEEEQLSIKAELEVDPQNQLRAMLNRNTSFAELVKKEVKQYLATRVTLQTYYDDLNSDRVKRELRDHINGSLQQFGRRVAFISLKPDLKGGEPRPYNGETIVQYKHHESTEPVNLKISVLLKPFDATRYRAKGSPQLSTWLQSNLDEAVTLSLFGVSYVNLLLDFRGPKQRIVLEMSRRAESIGYKIEQLMTMLSMKPLIWTKGFDIEIKNTQARPNEAVFETNVSGVYVGLEVYLTAKVRDLRGVSRYLTTDLPQKMKEAIVRLLQNTLHATDPQQFYKNYREGDKKKPAGGGSFEADVQTKISYLLETEFNADVIQLVLKPTDTALTIKVSEVAKESHDFTATAEIGTSPGAPKISVRGSFTVEGVSSDGWEKFRERDVTADKLKKRVADSVCAFIKRTSDTTSALSSQEAVVELIKHALQSARGLIEDEFGLAIKLATISWDWDEGLKKIGETRNKEDLEAIHSRIAQLKDMLLDLYQYNGSQERIDDIRASIERLSAMVPAPLAASVGYKALPEPPPVKKLPAAEAEVGPGVLVKG